MKWINAEQQVTVIIYNEEHEEHLKKVMTIEEMIDTYTNEGCPTTYSSPQKKGTWEEYVISRLGGESGEFCRCSECGYEGSPYWSFCPGCGADMREEKHGIS